MTVTIFAGLAGALAVLNPCGIALLPGVLSLTPTTADARHDRSPRAPAVRTGLALTAGAVATFGVVAAPIALGAQLVAAAVPWVGLILGVAMTLLALFVLAGKRIALPGMRFGENRQQGQRGVFLVGAGFGVASLGCGLPLFLAALGAALAAGGRFAAVAVVAAYAAGMAVALITVMSGMSAIRDTVTRLVGRSQTWMRWITSALLLLAGGYLTYYWAALLFTSAETRSRDPLVTTIDRFGLIAQRWLDTSAGGWVFAAGIVVAAAVALRWLWRWSRTEPTIPTAECDCAETDHSLHS
jgi:cytochrome c-type biogenesis protein